MSSRTVRVNDTTSSRRAGPRFAGAGAEEEDEEGERGAGTGTGTGTGTGAGGAVSRTASFNAMRWRQGPARRRLLKKKEQVHLAFLKAPSASTMASAEVPSALKT